MTMKIRVEASAVDLTSLLVNFVRNDEDDGNTEDGGDREKGTALKENQDKRELKVRPSTTS